MYEHGSMWTITSPQGYDVTFNQVGSPFYLEEITGFDSPNVRQSVEDIPEYDGAVFGNFYYGSRPVTFRGRIVSSSATSRNLAVVQLQRALHALRDDATIWAYPTGLPPMRAKARIQNLRVTGGFVKEFQIGMICADPRLYSQDLHSLSTTASTGSVVGAPWPIAWPAVWGGGTGATAFVNANNVGNIGSPPIMRVSGPITDPVVVNATTGESIYLDNLTLGVGDYVDLEVDSRTAIASTVGNVYSRVRFPATTWWLLEPGNNTVELRGSSSGSGAQLTVYWRDAWV
jgi:hypothetical protein